MNKYLLRLFFTWLITFELLYFGLRLTLQPGANTLLGVGLYSLGLVGLIDGLVGLFYLRDRRRQLKQEQEHLMEAMRTFPLDSAAEAEFLEMLNDIIAQGEDGVRARHFHIASDRDKWIWHLSNCDQVVDGTCLVHLPEELETPPQSWLEEHHHHSHDDNVVKPSKFTD